MDAPLYNARILRLAASIPHVGRLEPPGVTVERRSPICGSRVTADVETDAQGRVARFAQQVRACALGQASAAILGGNVLGRDAAGLEAATEALKSWLKQGGPLPDLLAEAYPELALFAPVHAHPARHPSILLAFEAAAAAAREGAKQSGARRCAQQAASPARAEAG